MFCFLQNGSLLLSQFLHDDPILRLKCRTWQPHKNYGSAEQVSRCYMNLLRLVLSKTNLDPPPPFYHPSLLTLVIYES